MSEDKKKNNKKRQSTFMISLKTMFLGSKRAQPKDALEEELIQSPGKTVMREFFKRRLTIVGLIGFFTIFLASMIIPFFRPADLTSFDTSLRGMRPAFGLLNVPRGLRNDVNLIAPGPTFNVGVDSDNNIYFWGTATGVSAGIQDVVEFDGGAIRSVSSGLEHVVVVTEDNRLYAFGNDVPTFRMLDVPADIQGRVVDAVAGFRNTVVILTDGSIRVFGGVGDSISMIQPM
ncbi:MAG: hypothetical protein FWC69_02335, partial [Defluviitaleaceae bacterium]|nr:hypothetical protein [Defluviitaleaceae bacterium]